MKQSGTTKNNRFQKLIWHNYSPNGLNKGQWHFIDESRHTTSFTKETNKPHINTSSSNSYHGIQKQTKQRSENLNRYLDSTSKHFLVQQKNITNDHDSDFTDTNRISTEASSSSDSGLSGRENIKSTDLDHIKSILTRFSELAKQSTLSDEDLDYIKNRLANIQVAINGDNLLHQVLRLHGLKNDDHSRMHVLNMLFQVDLDRVCELCCQNNHKAKTPLHVAASNQPTYIVEMLLDRLNKSDKHSLARIIKQENHVSNFLLDLSRKGHYSSLTKCYDMLANDVDLLYQRLDINKFVKKGQEQKYQSLNHRPETITRFIELVSGSGHILFLEEQQDVFIFLTRLMQRDFDQDLSYRVLDTLIDYAVDSDLEELNTAIESLRSISIRLYECLMYDNTKLFTKLNTRMNAVQDNQFLTTADESSHLLFDDSGYKNIYQTAISFQNEQEQTAIFNNPFTHFIAPAPNDDEHVTFDEDRLYFGSTTNDDMSNFFARF